MASRVAGVVFMIIGITFMVIRLAGGGRSAYAAIGIFFFMGGAVITAMSRGPKPPPPA